MTTKGEKTRKEIVERALALANELGLEGVSLGVLAAGLELSKSGLFAHFESKEALQLEVVNEAIERFSHKVVRPAIAAPRGEPRVRAMFEGFRGWIDAGERKGGCFFMSLSHEYDDRPGAIRDLLVRSQQDWRAVIAKAAHLAKEEKHFGSHVDTEQFAYEMVGIGMAYQQAFKLLEDPRAAERANAAFEALLERSRAPVAGSMRPKAGRRTMRSTEKKNEGKTKAEGKPAGRRGAQ